MRQWIRTQLPVILHYSSSSLSNPAEHDTISQLHPGSSGSGDRHGLPAASCPLYRDTACGLVPSTCDSSTSYSYRLVLGRELKPLAMAFLVACASIPELSIELIISSADCAAGNPTFAPGLR
eukprot:scaffold2956_cov390-Prasinococcus_capsulatus_cf.AAC.10